MTSATYSARHQIAWLYYHSSPVSEAKIGGPFFNTGTNQDIEHLTCILKEEKIEAMYGKFIIDFIYPKNERNGMSEGQTFAYPSSSTGNVHTVTVRLEYNDRFQETGGKPIEIWIVYQPKLPAGEIDMDEPDSWNTIKSAVTSGESNFNLGSFKTPISSFASDKEAWDHVQSVLNEKKAELKKNTDVEFDTEIWPDTEQNLSYAVVVGPQDPLIRAAKHVVAMRKIDSK